MPIVLLSLGVVSYYGLAKSELVAVQICVTFILMRGIVELEMTLDNNFRSFIPTMDHYKYQKIKKN